MESSRHTTSIKNNDSPVFSIIYYTAGSFLIGVFLVILTILGDMILKDISLSHAFQYHFSELPYILLDILPIVLAVYGFFTSKLFMQKIQQLKTRTDFFDRETSQIKQFIDQLINGNTDVQYEFQDEEEIGSSLVQLRDHLKDKEEEEAKRQKEEAQRTWINEGLAKFSDILRNNSSNMEALSYETIRDLVEYLQANQGAFFLLVEDDETDTENTAVHFEMTGCYAYGRKKYPDKRIEWGEGLIGTCALEKETIHMTDVPETYVNITSGLGKATPTSLLMVPLQIDEKVYGVIEIGSFEIFETYHIEFVERIATNIASVIANVKANEKTARLLEESRKQAKELSQNEEELRQNMEEVQTAKEEAARQTEKFINFTNTVNHAILRMEFDQEQNILFANNKFIQKLGLKEEEDITNKNIKNFLHDKDREYINNIWEKLINEHIDYQGYIKYLTGQQDDLWTKATFNLLQSDGEENNQRILFLGTDVTDIQKANINYKGQISALEQHELKVVFSIKGEFMDANDHFIETMEYKTFDKFETKRIFDLIDHSEMNNFNTTWTNITKGSSFEGVIKLLTRSGREIWINGIISGIEDTYGDIDQIVLLGYNITEYILDKEKLEEKEKLIQQQQEELQQVDKKIKKEVNKTKREIRQEYKETEKVKTREDQILENALDAIITFDHLGIILFFNKAAENLTGFSKEQTIGARIGSLFSQELIEYNDFVAKMVTPVEEKSTEERHKAYISSAQNEDIPVTIYLTKAESGKELTYTAFIHQEKA